MICPEGRWSLEPLAAAFHDPARLLELGRNTGLVLAGTVAVALGWGCR